MQKRRVVITGLGAISALGKNVANTWQNVINCNSGIAPIELVDITNLRFKNGAEVKDYDPLQYFQHKDLLILDKFSQFALIAAQEAINDAAIEWTDELKNSCSIITGCSIGGQNTQDVSFQELYVEKKTTMNPLSIPRIMPNAGASNISMFYDITGFAYTITTA